MKPPGNAISKHVKPEFSMHILYTYRKDGSVFSNSVSAVNGEITLPFSKEIDKLELKLEQFKVPTGSDGYFLLPNLNYASTPGALIRFKERPHVIEEHPASFSTPVFGVTTGSKGVLAVVTQEKYSYSLKVEVTNGCYELSVIFTPEALPPVIKLFELEGEDADYSGMARCYRNYQLTRGACRTLRERIKEDPRLEECTRSTMIRMRMGWKPVPPAILEQTDENEPPLHVAITFDRAKEILKRCREKGLKHAEFCLVGWNKGGHDGAFPDLFPVEEAFGGEKKLRELLEFSKEVNYNVSAHTNLIDSYSFSKRCTPAERLIDPDGSCHLGGQWGGGQSYYLCPKCAHEKFAAEDFTALKELGFRGTHYLDVSSIKIPDSCYSPDHPLTKEENAYWRTKSMALAREVFGAVSSEGPLDFCVDVMDYALYVNFGITIDEPPVLCEEIIPFWSLVYHGIVTCNCSYATVNEMVKDDPDLWLFNLEFGGRPTAYFHSKFRPASDAPDQDLRCSTDEELESGIDALLRRAQEFDTIAHLQLEFIEKHEIIAPRVVRERYSDGTVITINRSSEVFDGIAPKSYRVTAPEK